MKILAVSKQSQKNKRAKECKPEEPNSKEFVENSITFTLTEELTLLIRTYQIFFLCKVLQDSK